MEDKTVNSFWWFLAPKQWWFRHLIFWGYRFNNYLFHLIGWYDLKLDSPETGNWQGEILNFVFLGYIHFWFAIPKLLLRQKILLYGFFSVLSLCLFAYVQNFLYPYPEATSFFENYHYRFVAGMEILIQATSLRLFVEFIHSERQNQILRNENLHTELAYLKNQLNPHFLFNVLNNIAVISEKYPEKVTPTIIELSNVLRYQLYESEKESVLLSKEIKSIEQYLNLEAMRLNDATWKVREEGNIKGVTVAPLLFLPFIENATKHSADPSGKVTIDVLFKVENDTLIFIAKNTKPTTKAKQLDGGIGLKNIQRRLELLYPQRHTLLINDTTESYTVEMKIIL